MGGGGGPHLFPVFFLATSIIDLSLLIAFLSLLVLSKKRMVKLLASRTLTAVLIFSFGVGARDGGDRTENYLVVMKGER